MTPFPVLWQSGPADDTQPGLCSVHTWNCVLILNSVGDEHRNSGCLVKWILAMKDHPILLPFLHSLKVLGQHLSLELAVSSAQQLCPKGWSCQRRTKAAQLEISGSWFRIWLVVGHGKRTPGLGYSWLFFHKLKQSQSSWNVQPNVRVMETAKEVMDFFSSFVPQLMWDHSSILSLQALKY